MTCARILATALLAAALLAVPACGGGGKAARPAPPPPAKPARQLPVIDGLPVYDVPIEEAGAPVQHLWGAVERARRERLGEGAGIDALREWLPRRVGAVKELRDDVRQAAAGAPRDKLFAAIVVGWLWDDVVAQVRAVPPPAAISGNPDSVAAYRDAIDGNLGPVANEARSAYLACAELAGAAPPVVQPWQAECKRRGEALRELSMREPAPPERQIEPDPACAGDDPVVDPIAPPADLAAPPEIAVVVDGDRFEGADREQLRAAVFTRLFALWPTRRFVPLPETVKADRLVSQRRWKERGPICGQPPPLPALLAPRHKHLILARVETLCAEGEAAACGLHVTFSRAGSDDTADLPEPQSAKVSGDVGTLAAWLLAAAQLGSAAPSPILATVSGRLDRRDGYFDLAGYADDDPWLRVAPTLRDQPVEDSLVACRRGLGAIAYAVKWTIGANGKIAGVQVSNVVERLKDNDSDAEKRCIAEVMKATAWPCPRGGKPVKVEAVVCIGK